MTFSDAVFWVFAVVAVLPAVAILFAKSIVRMAFLLLFSLAGFAGLYLQLGASFLGFTQVIVYIGGILILFLFGVMLTSKIDVPIRDTLKASLVVPGAMAGLLLTAALVFLSLAYPWVPRPADPAALAQPDAPQIGFKVLSTYVLPFEAVSVLLLVAMVGATYIARGHAPGRSDEPGAKGGEA